MFIYVILLWVIVSDMMMMSSWMFCCFGLDMGFGIFFEYMEYGIIECVGC